MIGGGLSGLVVALRRADAGDQVSVFERGARLGGQLWSEQSEGFLVEHGAEGFVARSEALPNLARRVALEARLAEQLSQRSYGFDGSELVALAAGQAAKFLGFQVPADELGRGIRTFAGGMAELSDALVRAAAGLVGLHTHSAIERVTRNADAWQLRTATGVEERFDQVVVATGAAAAAALLAPTFGAPLQALSEATTLSSVTVSLAFERSQIDHPLDGTGFVVALGSQEHGFRACTFVSSKFAERAPPGKALLRLFFRPTPTDLELSDEAWASRAAACLAAVLRVNGAPLRAWVSRWNAALPVFDAVHPSRVAAAEAALAGQGIWLCGAAFHGSGIDAAVRSAETVASQLGLETAGRKD